MENIDGDSLIECGMNINRNKEVEKIHPYAITFLPNGRYQTYYKFDDGQRKKLNKKSEQEILDALHEIYFGARFDKLTVAEAYARWKNYRIEKGKVKNTTIRRNDTDWETFYLKEPLSAQIIRSSIKKLTVDELEDWATSMIKKHNMTKKTFDRIKGVLNGIIEYAIRIDAASKNPLHSVRIRSFGHGVKKKCGKPSGKPIFKNNEIEPLIAYSKEKAIHDSDELWLAFIIGAKTGLRIGEIMALKFEDFDEAEGKLYVGRSLTVSTEFKGEKWGKRIFCVEDRRKDDVASYNMIIGDSVHECVKEIKNILSKKGIEREFLFINPFLNDCQQLQSNITENILQKRLEKMLKELEIPHKPFHGFRAYYATNLFSKTTDIGFVSRQLGHSQISTTMKYLRDYIDASNYLDVINEI